jgi:XTP/dITP diphosphohydrolase/tetrapyrrole methylase family protein/MazG family protein
LQTIDRLDLPHMEEELGDVLLQVVMHAQIAKEAGHFDFQDVSALVNEKLIRRHPHVFGENKLGDAEAVLEQWDAIKAKENKRGPEQTGKFKDLPAQLPALMFAKDVYKQIQKQGLNVDGLIDHGEIECRAETIADERAVGEQLFQLAAACRIKKIDPESALRRFAQGLVDEIEARDS